MGKGGHNKLTTEEFIEKAKKVHGKKYSYDEVEYLNSKTKVKIICTSHGEFLQTPNCHLKGDGCNKCEKEFTMELKTKKFINKAVIKHKNKYDYSLVKYSHSHSRVKIICEDHGIFEQEPYSHLKGHGCPICSQKIPYDFKSLDVAVKLKHRGDIKLAENQIIQGVDQKYLFMHSCGHKWYATASSVLYGKACPVCAQHGFNPSKVAIFYLVCVNGNQNFTGLGITNDYKTRKKSHARELKANNCSIINEILISSDGYVIQKLEKHIKQTLNCNNSNIKGFKTESVLISPEELKEFCIKWLDKNNLKYSVTVG